MNSMTKIMFVFSILLLATMSFTTSDVFASHFSDQMKWHMVYISSNKACSNYDYQMIRTYSEITKLYLDEYQLVNSQYESICIPDEKYSGYIPPYDVDLVIMILDRDLGREELHSQNMGGYYHHVGRDSVQNHVIVMCDCPTYKYSSPTWILSHELSHFVLTYLGYDMSIIESLVHLNDDAYDECIRSHSFNCSSFTMKLRSETSAYSYSVMSLYEPAIGSVPAQETDEELPIQVVELSKTITKWWTQGKITDGDLTNAIGFMATGNSLFTHMNPEILTADNSFDDELTWKELLADELGIEKPDILERVPDIMLSNDDMILDDGKSLGIPTWFKATAKWWIEGKISDSEFKKNVNFLRNEGLIRTR